MKSYFEEISNLFDFYEENQLSESDIFERCNELIKKHNFNRDYILDLNDVLFSSGYDFQYNVEELDRKQFDLIEFGETISNASKSLNKTAQLVDYLCQIHDHRLTFASMYALKVEFLIALKILPDDNEYINAHKKDSLRDLLFLTYWNHDIERSIIIESLGKIGVVNSCDKFSIFRLNIEYLLWKVEKKNKNKGYLISNTIKVIFGITPVDYLTINEKKYYDYRFTKKVNSYLKQIDKKDIKQIMNSWDESINLQDGYKCLFLVLTM